jgi:threonine/homoserine/homoserine lactone efflux protein
MMNKESDMNSKAAIFSAIAILGTAWLLWAGYQGMDSQQWGQEEDERRLKRSGNSRQ